MEEEAGAEAAEVRWDMFEMGRQKRCGEARRVRT